MPKQSQRAAQGARVTTPPPGPESFAPRCQSCDTPLTFIDLIVGGVKPLEEWDRYVCRRCGSAFEYQGSTGTLKRSV